MTECYKCDKCGRLFDSYDECRDHELKHWTPEVNVWNDELQETEALSDKAVFKPTEEEPIYIHIRMSRWDYEKGGFEYRYGKYKLVSSYSAPLTIVEDEKAGK